MSEPEDTWTWTVKDLVSFHQGETLRLKDRIATLEAERDALAAALSVAEATISRAMEAASRMNLNAAGCALSHYQMCGRDYPLILAARDRRVRNEALEEAAIAVHNEWVYRIGRDTLCFAETLIRAMKEPV